MATSATRPTGSRILGNIKTFYIVSINGTDAALSALKAGEIDAHDSMYDIGPVVSTIDVS
jgi:hypothetical protein